MVSVAGPVCALTRGQMRTHAPYPARIRFHTCQDSSHLNALQISIKAEFCHVPRIQQTTQNIELDPEPVHPIDYANFYPDRTIKKISALRHAISALILVRGEIGCHDTPDLGFPGIIVIVTSLIIVIITPLTKRWQTGTSRTEEL